MDPLYQQNDTPQQPAPPPVAPVNMPQSPLTQPSMPEPPQKKSNRLKYVVFGVVAVVVIIILIVVGLLLTKKTAAPSASSSGSSYSASEDNALDSLKQKGATISSSSLSAIDKTDLFYVTFRNAARQQIVTTTKNLYQTADVNGTPLVSSESNVANVTQDGYDYTKAKLSYQSNVNGVIDKCVDGVDHSFVKANPSGGWSTTGFNSNCQASTTPSIINDGLNTGGLSNSQSQAFVDNIRNVKGLVNVTGTSVVSQQGKNYVRINVAINKGVDCSKGSVASGTGCFSAAFRSLGLPSSWPYTPSDSLVTGAQLAYFVDPATQLPAYMQIAYTPVSGSAFNWQNQQIEYSFGQLPTMQVEASPEPATLSWPVQQL